MLVFVGFVLFCFLIYPKTVHSTLHSAPFFLKIARIKRLTVRAAILVSDVLRGWLSPLNANLDDLMGK